MSFGGGGGGSGGGGGGGGTKIKISLNKKKISPISICAGPLRRLFWNYDLMLTNIRNLENQDFLSCRSVAAAASPVALVSFFREHLLQLAVLQ